MCSYFFLITKRSHAAISAGRRSNINNVEKNVPSEIALHIFAAVLEAKLPTIAVTIVSTPAEVRIA